VYFARYRNIASDISHGVQSPFYDAWLISRDFYVTVGRLYFYTRNMIEKQTIMSIVFTKTNVNRVFWAHNGDVNKK